MVGWGLCSVLMVRASLRSDELTADRTNARTQSTAFNFPGLLVARVGLGVFEAGFGPGIPLYLCASLTPSCFASFHDSDMAPLR